MKEFKNLDQVRNEHLDDIILAAQGEFNETAKALLKIFSESSVNDVADRFGRFEHQWYRHGFAHCLAIGLPALYEIKDSELFFQGVRICRTDFGETKGNTPSSVR